ncbi:hypothetical protein AGMMS50229_04150 [Campylobacterota bacterium]|nr:hypothetical protein AGMMS50229_04150 [Campylobacterota bacterium]
MPHKPVDHTRRDFVKQSAATVAAGILAARLPVSAAEKGDAPIVYMTTDISPRGLMQTYKALGREPSGKVAIKLSMGEPGGHNFLAPKLIEELTKLVGGTIVDSNTAYGGNRATVEKHLKTARDHGFSAIAPIDILDSEGEVALPVPKGKHIKEDIVGSHFKNYDFYLILSHFKGHQMGGFGGALKNIAIGFASLGGKLYIHSAGKSRTSWITTPQNDFLEAMAEAAQAITLSAGKRIAYINVMNRLSVDCDCSASPAEPDMKDIGILSSLDPVALDQACVDLVKAAPDGGSLVERMRSQNGEHILTHSEKLGVGKRQYKLVKLG